MTPLEYYQSLNEQQKINFAARANTTLNYLRIKVFRVSGAVSRPKDDLLIRLVNASEGNVSLDEGIDYFTVQPIKEMAQQQQTDKAA